MYYFAYASNLDKKQMKARCPDSKPASTATLPNYVVAFVGWSRQWKGGVATIKRKESGRVRGALYQVSDRDLLQLDRYEGYPKDYDRLNISVFDEDGNLVEAMTYIKAGGMEENAPSKEYLATIQQGYKDWNLGR